MVMIKKQVTLKKVENGELKIHKISLFKNLILNFNKFRFQEIYLYTALKFL
jgi:hypothetical protein